MSTNTTSTLSNQFQRKYQKDLLAHAVQELRLNEFATQRDLPKNAGAKTVRYFRRVAASAANVKTLAEGVTPTDTTDLTYTPVDVDLVQLGEVMVGTDILSWTQLLDWIKDGTALLGEDCALKADEVTRNVIVAGITAAGYRRYSQGAANWAALAAASAVNAGYVRTDGLDAVTKLKIARAPKFGGYYVNIIAPQVARDVQEDGDWLEASKYGAPEQLFKGELGRMDGMRFVEATNPFIEDGAAGAEGTFAADGNIFTSIITGKGGYGVCKLAGTQSPMKPQLIICNKADKSDPLNQRITVGWKAYYNAFVENSTWVCTLRSKSNFAG
jgi:N4-gp56 family major capsid protein